MSVSVRVRAAVYGAAVTFATVIFFVALLLLLVQQSAPEDQDKALDSLAAATAADLATTPPEALVPVTPPVLLDPAASLDPFVVVLADDGTMLYRTVAVDGGAPEIPPEVVDGAATDEGYIGTVALGDVEVRIRAVPWTRSDGAPGGVVVVGQSVEAVTETMAGLSAFLAVAAVFALVFAFAVGWIVSGRALRPLRELVATTDEIGGTGDLSRRLPPNDTKDEVGRLTRSFNAMLDRLEASRRELASALDAQRRFVADASHELRSPLTTIRSNAGFLRERPDASAADRAESLADIQSEADRMAVLVDDLLTLARGEHGAAPETPVDLSDLVDDEMRLIDGAGPPAELTVEGDAIVRGDADMLRRLVRIILDNAAKHGGGPAAVRIVADDETIALSVTDRGPGFPEEDLDRVFDRFYRADPARSGPGAGLGLAIARSVVIAHGGSIIAANEPGGGARVTVVLPRG